MGSNGTLIIPTFNFDFCQGKKYVHEETPSQVGIFSNYMLGAQGDLRSFHPIYSAVAIGRESKSLVTSLSNSSFGHGSLFHWLHTRGAKLVFLTWIFIIVLLFTMWSRLSELITDFLSNSPES